MSKQRFPMSPPQSIFRSLGLKRHKPRAKPFAKDSHNMNSDAKVTRCRSGSFDDKQDQQHQHQHQPGLHAFGRSGMGGGKTRSGWLTSLIGSLHGNVGHGHHDPSSASTGGGMPHASSSSNTKISRYDLLGRKKSRDRDRDMTASQAVINKTDDKVDEQDCQTQQHHQPQEHQTLPNPNPTPSRKQQASQRKTEDKRKKHVSELDFVDDELYDSDEDEIGAQPDVVVPSLARDDFVTYQTNQRRKGKERNKPRISMMWM